MTGVNGEIIPMKDAQVLRSNIEIDLCSQQLQANMEHHTNPAPWPFISNNYIFYKYYQVNIYHNCSYLNLNKLLVNIMKYLIQGEYKYTNILFENQIYIYYNSVYCFLSRICF